MPKIHQWLSEYGESHKNETNKAIHWICVPIIFLSITGLLFSIKLSVTVAGITLNVAIMAMVFIIAYYIKLSKTLWVGMLLFGLACLMICQLIENANLLPLWLVSVILFVLAWLGQFYGHKVEGKKPSFLKDLQFLLIGPAWLMSFIYQKMGIRL
ncbi:MAG: Mpo1-like protein [Ferruginibacter sp.]